MLKLLHLLSRTWIILGDGFQWSLRKCQLRTPPGPEGSNGSGKTLCRSKAVGSHHLFNWTKRQLGRLFGGCGCAFFVISFAVISSALV